MIPLLRVDRIVKRYPGVTALAGVSLEVYAGEIVALVGENGAGKSTLINILAGATQPDEGSLAINGRAVHLRSPAQAHRLGIGVIHQDLRLVPALTVAENIMLGREPVRGPLRIIDREAMHTAAAGALAQMDCSLPLQAPVSTLPHVRQQMAAIARAVRERPNVLALDEPTASLSAQETASLFALLRRLASAGTGILYISHRLEEVFGIAHRIIILRDGSIVGDAPASSLDRRGLIALMVGRSLGAEFPRPERSPGRPLLRLDRLSGGGVRDISLTLHAGEVLGVAGLVGAGRSELAHMVFGAAPVTGGTMTLDGSPFAPASPRDAIEAGVGLLTEDRNRLGVILDMNVRENMTLSTLHRFVRRGWIDAGAERASATGLAGRLRIKTPSVERPVSTLSGGNRQKAVLGRWLLSDARVLIFDEPTTGIDVGARREIYDIIGELAARSLGILIISSDLPELLGLCDTIAVLREGILAGTLTRGDATPEAVMELATPHGSAA